MKKAIGCLGVLCFLLFIFHEIVAAPAAFPLEPGQAVATCRSGTVQTPGGQVLQPFVVAVIDVRDPDCEAPGFAVPLSDPAVNWQALMYHNEALYSPTGLSSDEWSVTNLGEVFGVALDTNINPDIYVTSTRAYGNGSATGRVFKLDGTTGEPMLFATLPNNNVGLGNIAFSHHHHQLYVTNLEDGKIYRYDLSGTLLSTFDPFGPDDGVPGFSPLTERIWGINILNCRVYFGTWKEDLSRSGQPNEVWSLGLDASGDFAGPETLEVTLPASLPTTMPIADIAFSKTGKMLIAERGMLNDVFPSPHHGRVLEYDGGHLNWLPTANSFNVGMLNGGTNSAGGVDYDCAEQGACNLGGHILATGDALHCCFAPNNIYGLQILPDTGGDLSNSYIIDLDGGTVLQDKTGIGDVDSVRTCFPPADECSTDEGCSFTVGYWKNHHTGAVNQNRNNPWPIPENTLLCGQTWLDILNTPPKGNAWLILAHQWIAANLNVANGASPEDITSVLPDAESLLLNCSIPETDRKAAITLKNVLDDYNNGLIGPGHCF